MTNTQQRKSQAVVTKKLGEGYVKERELRLWSGRAEREETQQRGLRLEG